MIIPLTGLGLFSLLPRPPRGCHPSGRGRRVKAREATAQRRGLDAADSAEIMPKRRMTMSATCDPMASRPGPQGAPATEDRKRRGSMPFLILQSPYCVRVPIRPPKKCYCIADLLVSTIRPWLTPGIPLRRPSRPRTTV